MCLAYKSIKSVPSSNRPSERGEHVNSLIHVPWFKQLKIFRYIVLYCLKWEWLHSGYILVQGVWSNEQLIIVTIAKCWLYEHLHYSILKDPFWCYSRQEASEDGADRLICLKGPPRGLESASRRHVHVAGPCASCASLFLDGTWSRGNLKTLHRQFYCPYTF